MTNRLDFVHGAWPLSNLQKYPPISAQCCAERGGKGPGSLASHSHVIQLCPQGVVLSSWGTRPQAQPGLHLWVCVSFCWECSRCAVPGFPRSRPQTIRLREEMGTLKSWRCELKSQPSHLFWPCVNNITPCASAPCLQQGGDLPWRNKANTLQRRV